CFWSVKHCHHINLGREERSKRIFGQKSVRSAANDYSKHISFLLRFHQLPKSKMNINAKVF
ncbi:hypothetical protein QTO13_29875, partial [Vibrio parahaemolyticus]